MKQYWPMAIALDSSGKPIALFTTNSYTSKVKDEEIAKNFNKNLFKKY